MRNWRRGITTLGLLTCLLSVTAGCATTAKTLPTLPAACPQPPQPPELLMQPPPTTYLLTPSGNLQPTAPKRPGS